VLLERCGINVLHCESVDNYTDLDGLAALIAACDEVLTISNVTAHLAGALGVQPASSSPKEP
jgi:ADP-heptose:LPS heptosyltransferase